ncbi:hypothetical protein FG94_03273 [Massilia sp. LC238]|nr:hypothetical protein FG94_03273 [Massilia sp. LC238]
MIEKFLSSVLASATVSTMALAALAFLLREWIAERLKNSIKHEYDRDMESYKSMLGRVHAATAEGQKAAIERRMKAFDRMWKTMLSVRDSTGSYTFHFDIRTEAEWLDLPSNHNFRNLVGALDDNMMLRLMGDRTIEEERPYVGEVVWALFFAYRSFNMRLVHLARQSLSTPGSINWSADAATRGLLAATLSAEEIAEFDRLGISKVDFVRRTIEGKVLSAWHRLISGAEFGEEALRHAHALLKVVSRPA